MSYRFSEELIAHLRSELQDAQERATDALVARDKALVEARKEAEAAEGHLRRTTELRTLLRHHVDREHADQYAEPDASPAADPRRREFLDGLRKLIEYYELHPDLPTPRSTQLHVLPDRKPDAEQEIAEVARIAAAMGLTARREAPNRHFTAVMKFNDAVEVHVATVRRTDSSWKDGDELPQWFLHEQAVYAPHSAEVASVDADGGAK